MRRNWYYKELGHTYGPVSTRELVTMISRREIGPETLLLHHTIGRWVPACRISGLFRRRAVRERSPRMAEPVLAGCH
jgi:hypothetical protein